MNLSVQKLPPYRGYWIEGDTPPSGDIKAVQDALYAVTRPLVLVDKGDGSPAAASGGYLVSGLSMDAGIPETVALGKKSYPLLAFAPVLRPEDMGDAGFKNRHHLRYACIAGAMANGITSVAMVEAMARAGMMGIFGAAGLTLPEVEKAIFDVQNKLDDLPYGFNLIHSPGDPELEAAVADLYLRRGIYRICASAYLNLTLPLVRYRVSGIHQTPQGDIVCPHQIIAKVSREEVARKFFSPPPDKFLAQLVENRQISPQQAELARHIPMADSLTAEADSGGHTDNRPAISLLPTIMALRDDMVRAYRYPHTIPVGLGGGIGTPHATAAAFAMGAAYVLTGSVNQACVEAGTSDTVKRLLAETAQADVTMAPAADMFEMGVKVQVLKRGTMFAQRAAKLYELYSAYDCLEKVPDNVQSLLERDYFKCSLNDAWKNTQAFFQQRDPRQLTRAEKDPHYKMALVFRSYLGQSSRWATTGNPDRRMDYQIWCGPAMGAFNAWVRGSFLEAPEQRNTVTIAMNFLFGACILTRAHWIRSQGVLLPFNAAAYAPLQPGHIAERLHLPNSHNQ